jgi:hypothetical protein
MLLLMVLLATSCRQLEPYFAFFQEWNYSFDDDGGITFNSPADLLTWVHGYIAYVHDSQLSYYDPTAGTQEGVSAMNPTVWYTLNYGQAIYIATHDHAAWKGITGGKTACHCTQECG